MVTVFFIYEKFDQIPIHLTCTTVQDDCINIFFINRMIRYIESFGLEFNSWIADRVGNDKYGEDYNLDHT